MDFYLVIPRAANEKPKVYTEEEVQQRGKALVSHTDQGPDDTMYLILHAGSLSQVELLPPRPAWEIVKK